MRRTLVALTLATLLAILPHADAAKQAGKTSPSTGDEVMVDIPVDQLFYNQGGSDGAGLCVFASITFAAKLQNNELLTGLFDWMRQHPGGGWPEKVNWAIKKYASEKGVPVPDYIQYTGSDPSIIELALKTGRMPAVTWNGNHMVCCSYLDKTQGAILDNNDIKHHWWADRSEFLRRWKMPGSQGWVVILLDPPPPPPPKNRGQEWPKREPEAPQVRLGLPAGYEWIEDPERSGWFELRKDGKTIGCYHVANGIYRPYDLQRKVFGAVGAPPVRPPFRPPIFGMVADKIPQGECYWLNGKKVEKIQAFSALYAGAQLKDDSKLPALTFVGQDKKATKKAVDEAFAQAPLSEVRDKVKVQVYGSGDWPMRDGFALEGTGINTYLQATDGTVLARSPDFPDAQLLCQAIRRAHPDYDPSQDPGFSSPLAVGESFWIVLGVGWLILGGLGLYVFGQRKAVK